MSTSTLDLAPRDHSARGAGSNADAWTPPAPGYTAAGQALTRAAQPGYFDWLTHIRPAAGCTRPIRLTGTLDTIEATTGRLLDSRHTDQLPDAVIYKACGNRRSTVCPSCAHTYQRDAYQILRAGLIGGKGVPATVARHPAAFVTLTAPSFGAVHTRHVRNHTCRDRNRCTCRPDPCHARRDTGLCPHNTPAVCWTRHEPGDPQLGQPLCLDCYDHDHHVVWNLFSGELWHRTKQDAERRLAKLCKARGIPFHEITTGNRVRRIPPVRLAHGKAAEMQRRGAVHFHALIRLDGIDPGDPTRIVPPPSGIGIGDLVDALHAATGIDFTTPQHPDQRDGWPIGWGEQIDIRPISLTGTGEVTDSMVAGYLAKYATKSTEITGHNSMRITTDTIDQHADPDGDHIARLIDACWDLGRPTHTPQSLAERPVRHPEPGERRPFDTPWDCPECGTRTRYAACPRCVADRQASLDTKRHSTPNPTTPYARLRRWAHMLGFGGHFLTKARRYSVTFRLLRETRIEFRRAEPETAGVTVRTVDHLDETILIVGTLTFAGVGWHTTGDALLANSAAAQARERQAIGREELAHEASQSLPVALNAA
ncbi:replication initiator [Actinoplanes siamensis]|uniref:Plasmid replication initiator protein n=1 Tax=Actinoplanes siamensis TaxID=1223317 RepID=A0A919N5D9_9ACTN|nr:replication initiator [Actinoplanes siamensis]GIF04697.1 hypothetical protein Asi03nite_22350 [Actinoplanes siamensis]